MKRWRRPLIMIVLLLLAGAGVNLAIALAAAAAADRHFGAGRSWGLTNRTYDVQTSFSSYRSTLTAEYGWPMRTLGAIVNDTAVSSTFGSSASPEGVEEWRPPSKPDHPPRYSEGWPAPGLFERAGWFKHSIGRVPDTPIWRGGIVNTLFYAAILALPLSVFPIRRRLRTRRGRCPKCGYDLAGLRGAETGGEEPAPCPECGAAR